MAVTVALQFNCHSPVVPLTTLAMVLGDSVPLITRPTITRVRNFLRWGETLLLW